MARGLNNKLAGQIGEYLVCAELGRMGYVATPFAGNVPEYDLLVCDDSLNSVPIQVKASRGDSWPSGADKWMDIEIDDLARRQINHGPKNIIHPDLIYVCVSLGDSRKSDRFFICTKRDIQKACITSYTNWMDPKDWKRPQNYKSLDNRYSVNELCSFEDNWSLIINRLGRATP
jgi:hypothetical protein